MRKCYFTYQMWLCGLKNNYYDILRTQRTANLVIVPIHANYNTY